MLRGLIISVVVTMAHWAGAELAVTPIPRQFDVESAVGQRFGKVLYEAPHSLYNEMVRIRAVLNPLRTGESRLKVRLKLDAGQFEQGESYKLMMKPGAILIVGADAAGVFYGIETVRQILGQTQGAIPELKVVDGPRFGWRGLMLDSSRHSQSKAFIKRYLDILASLKMNRFHWHLTDNNGWRFESKKFPELTKVGAYPSKVMDTERNGFYSQEDMREVAAYAKSLHIQIIPEIDVPGHTATLLEAFPQFLCPHNRNHPPASTRINNSAYPEVLCVGNEAVYGFLDELFAEVIEIFKPEYIHIGGDEVGKGIWQNCPLCQKQIEAHDCKTNYELQKVFMNRLNAMLNKRGVKTIAWTEHPEQGMPEIGIAQGWYNRRNHAQITAKMGIPSLASEGDYAYFDYPAYPNSPKSKWMPMLSLEKVYKHKVIPEGFPAEAAKLIIGGECTIWTEELLMGQIDEQLFPRLPAFAEQMWSLEKNKSWDSFQKRLSPLEAFYADYGVKFGKPYVREEILKGSDLTVETALKHSRFNYPEYVVDGFDTTAFITAEPVKKGDMLTVYLDEPRVVNEIRVQTAGFFVFDEKDGRLRSGVLEVSTDGKTYKTVKDFENGLAKAQLDGQKIQAIRLRVTADQARRLVVNEIFID